MFIVDLPAWSSQVDSSIKGDCVQQEVIQSFCLSTMMAEGD